jgi:hypothetical protein
MGNIQFYLRAVQKLDAFWEWGIGNCPWKEGSERFLLVINNPFLFTSDLEML